MRVWLIEAEGCGAAGVSLEPALRALIQQAGTDLTLVGASSLRPELAPLLRAGLLNALIINTSIWNPEQSATELLDLGLPILLAGEGKNAAAWSGLAAQHTVAFVSASVDSAQLWCALWSLLAAHGREQALRLQADRFQQRLNDRIVIEKAKGILMQRLSLPEDEAYQRLRVQSRRQRKQIREIAQSILDTEVLLETDMEPRRYAPPSPPPERGSEPTLAAAGRGNLALAPGNAENSDNNANNKLDRVNG